MGRPVRDDQPGHARRGVAAPSMEPRSIAFLVEACGGRLAQGAGAGWFHGVSTDSRHFVSGQAFVALSGDRHDGHGFLLDVARSGAAALVVEEGKPVSAQVAECAVVRVPDTRAALGRLAGVWRRELTLPVIAVAGSNGKTTTKEMLGSVLSQRYRTVRSRASYNNDVGVPLTLLTLDREHEVAVVEAGTNHPGELAPLLEIIRPGLGVLTSIGREHLEHFGTLEAVAREEGALAAALPEDGCLFIDGDTPLAGEVTGRTRASGGAGGVRFRKRLAGGNPAGRPGRGDLLGQRAADLVRGGVPSAVPRAASGDERPA
jgi:UDP-N-acetylmuramoyl-tripeptide--D-alanyl-D-alanine ligase